MRRCLPIAFPGFLGLACALGLAVLSPGSARAAIVADLSSNRVTIQSNFTGTDVLLFGTVEPSSAAFQSGATLDVVAVVRGPRADIVARLKKPVFGLWLNAESRTFRRVPSYLAILSTRPIADFLKPATAKAAGFALREALPPPVEGNGTGEFRDAVVRLKRDAGLWLERSDGVRLITPSLFRATIPIPANVPLGMFEVEASLYAGDTRLGQWVLPLEVVKAGFEEQVASAAHTQPLLYGLGSAGLAILIGWLASAAFRRE